MSSIITGRVWKFGDDINTDIISPGQYMSYPVEKQAEHAMEAIDPDFCRKVKKGDILVVGNNFGSGSSRETAQMVLKHLGISAIVGKSFARIFFRNCINVGLPVVEVESTDQILEGDEVTIDLLGGIVTLNRTGEQFHATKLPELLVNMLQLGGLENFLAEKLNLSRNGSGTL